MINFTVYTSGGSASFSGPHALSALTQLSAKEAIHAKGTFKGAEAELYIPFHAIMEAFPSDDGQSVDPVVDDLCNEEGA